MHNRMHIDEYSLAQNRKIDHYQMNALPSAAGRTYLAKGGPAERHAAVERAHGERRALPLVGLLDALSLALDASDLEPQNSGGGTQKQVLDISPGHGNKAVTN